MYTPSSTLSVDSVLADLAADSWFQAQHDVLSVTAQRRAVPVTAPAPVAFDAYDRWAGDLSEVHAWLTANPAL